MKFHEYEHYKINEYSYGYKSFSNDDLQQDSTYSMTPDGVYNVSDKQFQKNIHQQNDVPNYLFFKPFFFFHDGQWCLFKKKCNEKFEILSEKIVKKEECRKKEYGLELNFSVDVEKNSFQYQNFKFQIDNVNRDDFLKYLENFKMHSNYYLTFNPVENLISDCCLNEGCLIKKDSFILTGTILFNFDIKAKEKISFSFNENAQKGVKKNNYFIKIPNYLSIEDYDSTKEYCLDKVVFYEGKLYKCIKNCANIVPSQNNEFWILIENFEGSFFNSADGKNALNFLRGQLDILVEQKISDEIILTLMHTEKLPALNDFFEFNGKNYRIIEILKKNIEGFISFVIKGVEILNLNDINFDEVTNDFDENYREAVDKMNFNKIDNTCLEVFFWDRLIINQEKNLKLNLEK